MTPKPPEEDVRQRAKQLWEEHGKPECEPITYKPARNVFANNRTNRYRAPILISTDAFAAYGPACDMLVKLVFGLRTAPIL